MPELDEVSVWFSVGGFVDDWTGVGSGVGSGEGTIPRPMTEGGLLMKAVGSKFSAMLLTDCGILADII